MTTVRSVKILLKKIMDDILSAALGKSGLNLDFLEDNQQGNYGKPAENYYSVSSNNINSSITHYDNISPDRDTPDDSNDLTDFLNMLGDNGPSHAQVADSKNINDEFQYNSNAKHVTEESNDLLDFLLKYNSDEDNSRPCSPAVTYSNMSPLALFQQNQSQRQVFRPNVDNKATFFQDNKFSNTVLTSQFPKFEKNRKVVTVIKGKNSLLEHSETTNGRLPMQNKYLCSKVDNSTQHHQHSVYQSSAIRTNTNSNTDSSKCADDDERSSNDELSNLDKKRKSIQHVLSSPNLTIREKQYIMKSAISHKMDPKSLLSSAADSLKPNLASLLASSPRNSVNPSAVEEDEDEDDNELMHSDTFAEYWPSKVSVGHRHPDPVVETSSMASVTPPDVWYNLLLPHEVIDCRKLSALQLESIVYSCQQHEKLLPNGKRAGFLIGDGAGVGKGRTVAGIIYENYLHGRKRAIWLSVSNDLRFDAIRDLRDIGCHVKVHPLNKFKYDEKISAKVNGKFKKGVIFSTYSALIGETSGPARFKSRLEQLVHWCGPDFDGVIILDECHKAKNLMPTGSSKPTKTGINVLKLQNLLPKARVVYCSATGASEPKNMAYMNRLGLWGPGTAFKEFSDFIQSVEKRGVGAMEMVAMDMKLRGMYIARQLSFSGVNFDVKEVKLCATFIEMYDAAVTLWLDAREKFETAAELVGLDSKGKKTMWGQFWSAHQRFFKYLCIAAKVKRAVEIAKEAVNNGKCVIFGLQSTGEARTLDQIDDLSGELNDFISTTKGVFNALVEKQFPTKVGNPNHGLFNLEERKRKRGDGNSSNEESQFSSKDDDLDNSRSDKGSDDESEPEEQDPFKESSSDSDGEDAWLRPGRQKNLKSSENIKKKSKQELNPGDASYNVLAAAGLNLGRQFSWTNPCFNSTPGSSDQMKSKRASNVPAAPTGLAQQMTAVNVQLKRSTSKSSNEERCRQLKQSLLDQLEIIAPYLPPNTLDELIDELGGPNYVAEMTGRKGRVVAKNNGSFVYEPRSKDDVQLEVLNVAEKQRFMEGSKLIAVISEAASSGISLQADRREKNQRRRVHITLELPWSADKAIQQFGRSHRSNQVSAPEYLFLISELAGEQRFASIVAKRLESLGALTHGDRRATETRDLSRFNLDTKYGRQALDAVLKSVLGYEKPRVVPPKDYKGNFLEDVRESLVGIGLIHPDERSDGFNILDKDYSNISRFLNRILGLKVALQNAVFHYFTETLNAIIREAKRNGRWDEGIVDLGSHGESVVQTDIKSFTCPSVSGHVTTELVTVLVERGLPFSRAQAMCSQVVDPHEGFYVTSQLRNGKKTAVLVLKTNSQKGNLYTIYRPNIGITTKQETLQEVQRKFTKVCAEDAQFLWDEQYDFSETRCCHEFWRGFCKNRIASLPCEVGARKRACYILCGSVLSVWAKVETILSCQPGASSKMQIIRAKLANGQKLVGMLIPGNCIDPLIHVLSHDNKIETK